MIVFDLKCDKGHVFEAWFRDSASFEQQQAGEEIACALCGSHLIVKAPMAPRLSMGRGRPGPSEAEAKPTDGEPAAPQMQPPVGPEAEMAARLMRELVELRRKVESNCDYVGARFPEEARAIHYGEQEPRGIYGEASEREARELSEEGITVAQVPWVPLPDA